MTTTGSDRVLDVLGETVILRNDPGGAHANASVMEEIVPPGFAAPWHLHTREDEVFYVVEGQFRVWRGDEQFDLGPGGVALLPRNQVHTFKNVGSTTARLLTVITPPGFERFFAALDERKIAEDDEDGLVSLAAEFGVQIVGPPPD